MQSEMKSYFKKQWRNMTNDCKENSKGKRIVLTVATSARMTCAFLWLHFFEKKRIQNQMSSIIFFMKFFLHFTSCPPPALYVYAPNS